jgi:large subunit ribosomal protein L6
MEKDVSAEVVNQRVIVKGQKGQLTKEFPYCVCIEKDDNGNIFLKARDSNRQTLAMVGTARSLIVGMIHGVAHGFSKDLEISGVGFKAILRGNVLDLALGKSHSIHYTIPDPVKVTVTDGVKLRVEGMDKQLVGQVAADIRSYYPVEPYKGKGIRIVGQFVRRKAGKKTA